MYRLEEKYWWWVGRRKITGSIIDKLKLNPAKSLDAGCGTGINLSYFGHIGTSFGFDFSKDALKFCIQRGHNNNILQADAERLPFEDNSFDLVTAFDLLEHLDDKKALTEFYRIIKPNGYLILTVPAFNFMWSMHDEAVHHKRRYSKNELQSVIISNNFVVSKISYWNFFLFLPVVLVRLIKKIMKNNQVKTDTTELPAFINRLLIFVLGVESSLIRYLNLPVGVSLVCVAQVEK